MTTPSNAELIVLSAPKTDDPYYGDAAEDIFDFQVTFAKTIIANGDDVIILTDDDTYDDYADKIGEKHVISAPISDIWARDFGLSNTSSPVMFRYTAAGQGDDQNDADAVQEELAILAEDANLNFQSLDLLNDGGNFVDDYAGNVVISRKFLRDNNLNEDDAKKHLRKLNNIKNIAFIESDEQGGLEHADGVVSFIDTNTLIINTYDDDQEYAQKLRSDLENGLPNVIIHEIVTPYNDSEIYDERFGSACGLYTNALVTPERIYFPQFGVPEDKKALEKIRSITKKDIIPVPSHQVCHMGGGVRCMSWQLRDKNARKLREYAMRLAQ